MYCSGWVKTGPVGVILDTMSNAFETAETIIQDYKDGMYVCACMCPVSARPGSQSQSHVIILTGQLPDPALRDGLPPDLVSFLSSLPGNS